MLKKVFGKLDQKITEYNNEARESGSALLSACYIKVVGQSALLEAQLDLQLSVTSDVDAYTDAVYWIKQKFNSLLGEYKKHLDPHSEEVWMPDETIYNLIYEGRYLQGYIAQAEYVLFSKAMKSPQKNRDLLLEYLSKSPSDLFFDLSEKYNFDIKAFLNG